MLENINTSPNSRDDGAGTPENYLSRAVAACEAGDARLGLHLYLAAFEQAAEQSDAPSEDAIMGLKQAWRVACSTKERALAEYIFERLEPYLSDDEVQACVEQLQVLAMERLEGIGLSGDDLMEMTEALSGDFMEMVGPMMAAAVHGEDAAMAQAEALAEQQLTELEQTQLGQAEVLERVLTGTVDGNVFLLRGHYLVLEDAALERQFEVNQ